MMQRSIGTNMEEGQTELSHLEAKWGDAIKAGYVALPSALLRGQHLLKLSPIDMIVIANLNEAWWFADRLPYLRPETIAKRMGVSERSVQRSLSRLRQKKLLQQVRAREEDGAIRYYHDLSGLRARLEELARRDRKYSERNWRGNKEGSASAEPSEVTGETGTLSRRAFSPWGERNVGCNPADSAPRSGGEGG